jgi:hypothetical protein
VRADLVRVDDVRRLFAQVKQQFGFAGDFASEARDAGGNVVFAASGTVTGTRLQLEPLP